MSCRQVGRFQGDGEEEEGQVVGSTCRFMTVTVVVLVTNLGGLLGLVVVASVTRHRGGRGISFRFVAFVCCLTSRGGVYIGELSSLQPRK